MPKQFYSEIYLGASNNLWLNSNSRESAVFDSRNLINVGILGIVESSTNLKVYVSVDDKDYYYSARLSKLIELEEIPDVDTWADNENYKVGDLVEYELDNEVNIYECIKTHTNEEPPDEEYWELILEDVEGSEIRTFSNTFQTATRYIKLVNEEEVTVTATACAKP